jgi:hypothetical protein
MRIVLTLALAFVLFSCSDKEQLPSEVLPEQQMREVLWDLARVDEFVNTFVRVSDSAKRAESARLYNEVYKIHETSKPEVDKSFTFYQSRPDLLQPILDSLSRREVIMRQIYERKIDTANPKIIKQ